MNEQDDLRAIRAEKELAEVTAERDRLKADVERLRQVLSVGDRDGDNLSIVATLRGMADGLDSCGGSFMQPWGEHHLQIVEAALKGDE